MKQRVVHIIRVNPDFTIFNADGRYKKYNPEPLVQDYKRKGRIQDKSFRLLVTPLTHREYKHFSANRYSTSTIVKVFNENLQIHPEDVDEVDLRHILQFKVLLKQILDIFFQISGGETERINHEPKMMFDILEKYRRSYGSVESLMDRFVMNTTYQTGDFSLYRHYENLSTLNERMGFVALLELTTGINIESRYKIAQDKNAPIDLTHDDNTLNKMMGTPRKKGKDSAQIEEMTEITNIALSKAMARERRLKDLGITIGVNTARENEAMREMDS